eukprot:3841364-Alexandrium_andersonii.AAC.1
MNDPYCPVDSPGSERLQRSRKSEEDKAPFKSVKSEPARLQALVAKYHESVGGVGGERRVLPQRSWPRYREYDKSPAADSQARAWAYDAQGLPRFGV